MDLAEAQRLRWDKVENASVVGVSLIDDFSRPGLTAHFVGSKVYAVCGSVNAFPLGIMSVLDVSSNTWKDIKLPAFTERRDHVSFLWNDYIYVYGGFNGGVLTDYFRIDLLEEGKVEFLDCLWDGVGELDLDYFSGSLCEPTREFIMFGGKLDGEVSNRTFCVKIDKSSFYEPRVKGKKPPALQNLATCSVANKFYVYGGRNGNFKFSGVFVLCVSSGQYIWSEVAKSSAISAVSPRMSATGDKILVCGGNGREMDSLRIFSITEGRFFAVQHKRYASKVQVNRYLPVTTSHAFVANSKMAIVLGGYGMRVREYWTLQPES